MQRGSRENERSILRGPETYLALPLFVLELLSITPEPSAIFPSLVNPLLDHLACIFSAYMTPPGCICYPVQFYHKA